MSVNLEHLEGLARLAKEASPEGRQALLREVTDLFMEAPEDLSSTEVAYFGDIMERLVFELEMKARRHLAEALADVGTAPHELVTRLASDEIEVAKPVLMKSGVLADSDLLDIIKQCSQEHLLAVSQRSRVSEQVADALVEKGNDEVLGSLAGNAGAVLSRNAMETMVERGENGAEALQEALVTRRDFPPDLLQRMYAYVSDALRQHIVELGVPIDEGQIDDMLAETKSWLESDGADELSPAEKFILRKEQLNQLNNDLLVKLMRQGKVAEFVAGIAKMAKIDIPTARQTIFDKSGEKLAVICKSLEMDAETFALLVDLTDQSGRRDKGDKDILVGVYGRITPESAQRAMRFLRTRQKVKGQAQGSQRDWGT